MRQIGSHRTGFQENLIFHEFSRNLNFHEFSRKLNFHEFSRKLNFHEFSRKLNFHEFSRKLNFHEFSWNFNFHEFSWNLIFHEFSNNLSRKVKFHSNRPRIRGTCHEDQYNFFFIISRPFLLRMRKVSKLYRKSKTRALCSVKFFFSKFFPFML